MNTPFAVIALCACVLGLAACDKTTTTPPTSMINKPVPTESGATAGSATDPSVPSAESVFSPAIANKADPKLAKSDGTRSPAQASTGALMPGQNNDHSAPLGPAKRASSP